MNKNIVQTKRTMAPHGLYTFEEILNPRRNKNNHSFGMSAYRHLPLQLVLFCRDISPVTLLFRRLRTLRVGGSSPSDTATLQGCCTVS